MYNFYRTPFLLINTDFRYQNCRAKGLCHLHCFSVAISLLPFSLLPFLFLASPGPRSIWIQLQSVVVILLQNLLFWNVDPLTEFSRSSLTLDWVKSFLHCLKLIFNAKKVHYEICTMYKPVKKQKFKSSKKCFESCKVFIVYYFRKKLILIEQLMYSDINLIV